MNEKEERVAVYEIYVPTHAPGMVYCSTTNKQLIYLTMLWIWVLPYITVTSCTLHGR